MQIDAFWTLIQDSLNHSPDRTARAGYLHEQLIALPPGDIAGFQSHLISARQRADRWDLWGAAARINGGMCSDDGFEDFRNWLIGRGRDTFERAVAAPDTLAELPEIRRLAGRSPEEWTGDELVEWETLSYLAERAYAEATGQEEDDDDGDSFDEAVDEAVAEFEVEGLPDYLAEDHWKWVDEQASATRLPQLTSMFPLERRFR
jgi:hypothetical protein